MDRNVNKQIVSDKRLRALIGGQKVKDRIRFLTPFGKGKGALLKFKPK